MKELTAKDTKKMLGNVEKGILLRSMFCRRRIHSIIDNYKVIFLTAMLQRQHTPQEVLGKLDEGAYLLNLFEGLQ